MVMQGMLVDVPDFTTAGQLTMVGTRMPPS